MNRNNYSDETKAAVMAALLQGQSINSVAKEYNIPKGTVSGWKKIANGEIVYLLKERKENLRNNIIKFLEDNFDNLKQNDTQSRNWRTNPLGKLDKKERYIYFIYENFLELIKIGIATDLVARLASMQAGCPQELRLLGYIKSKHARSIEKYLHKKYYHKLYRGEWYKLQLSEIKKIILSSDGVFLGIEDDS